MTQYLHNTFIILFHFILTYKELIAILKILWWQQDVLKISQKIK